MKTFGWVACLGTLGALGCLGVTKESGAIGKAAPEIEGIDSQGRAFRLSDYRGKVVLLDFWRHN
jgi:hypothetical protein